MQFGQKNVSIATICVLVLAQLFWSQMSAANRVERPDFAQQTINLITPDAQNHRFTVEVAQTPDEKAFGLMFKRALPEASGMLFVWDRAALRNFWMRNTYIPLDILFFDSSGELLHIASNSTPLSDTQIPSLFPALYVLEIAAGEAGRLGIKIGSQLSFE